MKFDKCQEHWFIGVYLVLTSCDSWLGGFIGIDSVTEHI